MARYDYRCCKCGVIEEYEHRMDESPEIKCACGGYMRKHFGKEMAQSIQRCGKDGLSDWENIKMR